MSEKWDEGISDFPNYPKINTEMKQKGENRLVKIVEEPKSIPAEMMREILERKGITGIEPKDCFVMVIEDNGEKKNFWFNKTAYSIVRDLRTIEEANNGTLIDAYVNLIRTAVNDRNQPNWMFEPAKAEE